MMQQRVRMIDPGGSFRSFGLELFVKIVAFYFPGQKTPVDELCNAEFMGNFYLSHQVMNGDSFACGECAYHAQKFTGPQKKAFIELKRGEAAYRMSRQLTASARQFTSGEAWITMRLVVYTKFNDENLARMLDQTGNSVLVEHTGKSGRDRVWSNNNNGTGQNWLGLCLMIERDIRRPVDKRVWLPWIMMHVDIKTGVFYDNAWQDIVKCVTGDILSALRQLVVRPNAQPDVRPNAQPDVRPNAQPDVQPNAQPVVQPNAHPVVQPNAHPTVQSNAHPAVRPNAHPSVRPNAHSSVRPNAHSAVRPNAHSAVRPNSSFSIAICSAEGCTFPKRYPHSFCSAGCAMRTTQSSAQIAKCNHEGCDRPRREPYAFCSKTCAQNANPHVFYSRR